jgi:hypothetical protein
MVDPVAAQRLLQRIGDVRLPDDLREGRGAVAAVQGQGHLVTLTSGTDVPDRLSTAPDFPDIGVSTERDDVGKVGDAGGVSPAEDHEPVRYVGLSSSQPPDRHWWDRLPDPVVRQALRAWGVIPGVVRQQLARLTPLVNPGARTRADQ